MTVYEERLEKLLGELNTTNLEKREKILDEMKGIHEIIKEKHRHEEETSKMEHEILKEDRRHDEEISKMEDEKALNNKKFWKDIGIEASKIGCYVMGMVVVIKLENDGFIKSTLGKLFANKIPIGKL